MDDPSTSVGIPRHVSFGEKVGLMCLEAKDENLWFWDSFQSLGLFQGLDPKPYTPKPLNP